jgi:hypothetical protein
VNFLSFAASFCLQCARLPELDPDAAPDDTPDVLELNVDVVLELELFSSSESDSTVLTDDFLVLFIRLFTGLLCRKGDSGVPDEIMSEDLEDKDHLLGGDSLLMY